MKISPARAAAFDILLRIEADKAYSSVLLPIYEADLTAIDRGLCHELTLGTLRRQIYLDRIIDHLTASKKIDVHVRIALRLGLYQLNFLDKIPQYSAINESVNLIQRARKTSAKGFVNAILRRASRERIELAFEDDIDRISVETSHPRWLIEKWIADNGIEAALALANANNEIPGTAFRMTGERSEEGQILIESATRSRYVEGCYVLGNHDQRVVELVERGEIYLQDEASQIVAQAVPIPENGRFLDVCAAPGGKTGLIAGRYSDKAALLAAGDLHWPRVEYLRGNCIRQGAGSVRIFQYDAERALPFAAQSFDAVLVDAPCSGTGTIRHNPELRYSMAPDDLAALASKQLSILNNASNLVRADGTLIYSTCSVEREENEWVCDKFLEQNRNFSSSTPNVDERFVTAEGFARTWPQRDSMDGFFIAAFRRTEP